ncbi:hypothetical protein LDENG_00298530 [Lucifuga dentata]|nr:hypothetical protein LDENG_00298530 [Lucifuga dentata]
MGDPLSDCSPLISAAALGKLRLVRLLVEGGAQVNGRNPKGETPLLAACKALRGEPTGPETVKLLSYLLQNKADPNAQDRAGRTALMYACMERAGALVASILLSAGADPSMEDHSGASALVYAINAQHQPTVKVLVDACRAKGCDIIIIATETGVNGSPVTRRYLNVPPSPDTSPVSCMSPSEIVLKTGSPNSPEGENIFNFRGTGKRGSSSSCESGGGASRLPSCDLSPLSQSDTPPPRQRLLSEPHLAIHNLACLNQACQEGVKEKNPQEGEGEDLRRKSRGKEDENREEEESHFHQGRRECMVQRRDDRYGGESEDFLPRVSQSPGGSAPERETPKTSVDKLPSSLPPSSQLRRNTLPSVTVVPPFLHLPPLVNQSDCHLRVPTQVSASKSTTVLFLPHPPSSSPSSSSLRASGRPALLPPLPLASSVTSLAAPPPFLKSLCGHSVQLEQIRGGQMNQ